MELRTDRRTMQALLECEILEIRSSEGEIVSLEEAERDPEEVIVHSSSGKDFTFTIQDDIIEDDVYVLKEEVRHL